MANYGSYSAFDDTQLMRRIQQREEPALSELYRRYGALVYSVAYRVVQNNGLAEEVVQDTFLKVWTQVHTWDETRGKLTTWLLTITRYGAIDRLRQEQRRGTSNAVALDDFIQWLGSTDDTSKTDGEQMRRLLEKLPADQRQAIELAFFQGMSHVELAAHLKLPLGTVKTRVRTGLQRLRSLWQATENDAL